MTTEMPKRHDINWTPVVVGATAIGGGIVLYKMLQTMYGGKEADRELAREIMADWRDEFEACQAYVQMIYYGGRVPTDQELNILSSMLDQMSIKERTIEGLSKTVFAELEDLAAEIAAALWLTSKSFALAVLSGIGGYITYKIVREWKNRRGPPPNFPCPICSAVYGTKDGLKNHVDIQHPVQIDYVINAQVEFVKATTWVQNAVAVELFYGRVHTNWSSWSFADRLALNWNVISTGVYGIGSTLLLYRVAFWMVGIPI